MDLKPFLSVISTRYRLNPLGLHGLSHWARVLDNGHRLAEISGGDRQVITLFAIFHDACRINDQVDPGHGSRGADLAGRVLEGTGVISPRQLDLLQEACRRHTDGETEGELTLQVCWDADRLDLGRAHITPDPAYLCTPAARDPDLIHWANQRARASHTPPIVPERWLPIFV